MLRISEAVVWQQITFLGQQLHWSLDDLLDLSHRDRVRLVRLAAGIDEHRGGGGSQ